MLQTQLIYCGDNLQKLRELPDESVDLVYIDPPFNSNRNYEVFWGDAKEKRAFDDRFGAVEDYIRWMRPRVAEIYRVLKRTGSFYYHCDWHADSYVRIMLDQIYGGGGSGFQNHIAWRRTGAHNDSKKFGANHDSIFFYTKSKSYCWNRQFGAYNDNYIEQNYRYRDEQGRAFRVSDMTANKPGGDVSYEWTTPDGRSVRPYKGRYWAYSKDKLQAMHDAGLIYYRSTGMPMLKHYLDEMPGVPLQSFWDDLPGIVSGSAERLGYPTQKPLALLDRIIRASSNPGDVVLDAFCGCGTALVSAQNLGRRWVGIDISPTSCRVMAQRLADVCKLREGEDFWVRDLPKTAEELRKYPPFEFENWAVNALNTVIVNGLAVANKAKVGDMGIDGRIYPASVEKVRQPGKNLFGDVDVWFPVQVKQKDKVGRPEVDQFETAMRRQGREKGFFVAFGYSSDAEREIARVLREEALEIIPLTVDEILGDEKHLRI